MVPEVVQWLNEIQTLQQQLRQAQTAAISAQTSAENWRRCYETEAQQRRSQVTILTERMETLQAELYHLQQLQPQAMPVVDLSDLPEALHQQLLLVTQERDRLAATLAQEQTEHARTRQNLTTALGDAIARLKQVQPS